MKFTTMDYEPTQRYYSIGKVAISLGVAASEIRYWQKKLGLEINTNHFGIRRFTVSDFEMMKTIKHLKKERRFTIEGVKQELKIMGLL